MLADRGKATTRIAGGFSCASVRVDKPGAAA